MGILEFEFGDSSRGGVAFNSIPFTTVSTFVYPRQSNKRVSLLLPTPFTIHHFK